MMRPMIAWHCSKPWTEEDDRALRANLALLAEDVDEAGGPAAWIHSRLEAWLRAPAKPCRTPRLHARPRTQRV